MKKRIISILMENDAGALSRVVGLFSQRGYNIESLSVAPTEDETISRLTLTTIGNDQKIEQITKNLNKIIDVIKLIELSESAYIERELMMIKVKAVGNMREELKRSVDIFRGQIIDVTPNIYTIQLVGDSDKLTAFIRAVGEAVILEVVRTGISGISRGDKVLSL
ncbi:MAG: acetolactate synthase-1/3 small subunit [Candidatus Endobugula sp.]|jgi:acetolactate synthase-1/3 small subunit